MIKINSLSHIGVAVKNVEKAMELFRDILNLPVLGIEEVREMKVKVAKLSTNNTVIELIEPMEGEQAVSRFLDKRGEGIHHICLEVKNITGATQELIDKGYKPVYDQPRTGAGGHKVNFLSPKDTHGILIELCEV